MTDDDPVPLKAGGEATPELVRALYALGKRGPDSARLARVADKLAAALTDAPPPGAANGLRKWLGIKTLITGIVIGLGGLSWLGYHLANRHETPSKPRPAAVETSRAEPAMNEPAQVERPAPSSLADVSPPAASSRARNTSARRSGRRAVPVATFAGAARHDAVSAA
jgi:hypothetical protein